MKRSLRAGGGFLEIDHRDSPGLTPADVAHMPNALAVPGGQHYETDVYHCSHCQRMVVLRAVAGKIVDRGYCPKCNHYVCNSCEKMRVATAGLCVPFLARLEKAASIAEKFVGQPDHPDAKPDIVLTDPD